MGISGDFHLDGISCINLVCCCVVLLSLSRMTCATSASFVSKSAVQCCSVYVVVLVPLSNPPFSVESFIPHFFPSPLSRSSNHTPSLFGGHLTHRKPSHANNDVQPPYFAAGVFERPHTIAIHIPVSAGSRVHTALADFAGTTGGGFVDDALLDDGAVYGEAVGWCGGCGCGAVLLLFGGCGRDERFEDGVLYFHALDGLFLGRKEDSWQLTMMLAFQFPTCVWSYPDALRRASSHAC